MINSNFILYYFLANHNCVSLILKYMFFIYFIMEISKLQKKKKIKIEHIKFICIYYYYYYYLTIIYLLSRHDYGLIKYIYFLFIAIETYLFVICIK